VADGTRIDRLFTWKYCNLPLRLPSFGITSNHDAAYIHARITKPILSISSHSSPVCDYPITSNRPRPFHINASMAPSKAFDLSKAIEKQLYSIPRPMKEYVTTIQTNWHLEYAIDCIPPPLRPQDSFPQWRDDIIILLSQISSMPGATFSDFTRRLREAVKMRQNKNKSAAGKSSRVKAVDLRAVLEQYKTKAEENGAEDGGLPSHANGRNGGRTTRNTRIQVPKTPVNQDEDEEEEEEEGSSEPLAGGKYQYLNGVRPVKVNLNPEASPVKKPTRPKPPPRGKRRKANEEDIPDPTAVELPSLVHQDPDPRVPDDTGFLSDLEGNEAREKGRKRKKRLSRLEQERIRIPHWQMENDNIVVAPAVRLDTSVVEDEEEPELVPDVDDEKDLAMDNANQFTLDDESEIPKDATEEAEIEATSLLESLPELPANATVTEKRELEELKLSMEQRIWRIKVLRIEERVQKEQMTRREENSGEVEENAGREGRVLRKRRGK
jgi:hypothetical protein